MSAFDICVLVAAYNQEKYIGRCLRSVLSQNLGHFSFQVVVIDDGSTDNTSYALTQFCDPHNDQLKVITNERNLGLPASLNRGIEQCSAELIVRVDSDDFVNQNFLNFLYYYLECFPEIDAVGCDYQLVDDGENIIENKSCEEHPIACGVMFRRSHLIDIGMYDESFLRHEERELRNRFEAKYSIGRLPLPLYRYRRHDKNITLDEMEMRYHEERLKLKYNVSNI